MKSTSKKTQLVPKNTVVPPALAEVEGSAENEPAVESTPLKSNFIDAAQKQIALEESEARYRRLFETAKDGILILDGDTGRITDVNPFLQDMLGYTKTELVGRALWEIGPVKDIAASQEAMRHLQNSDYIRYEDLPLETKAGERKQVEFVSNVYLVNGWRVIQCNIREITARKHAEVLAQTTKDELLALVNELQFWVRDNGPGIPPAVRTQLFTAFNHVSHIHHLEHGLGLSIVFQIVEKLGGQVGVESEPGTGSPFYFSLPANSSFRERKRASPYSKYSSPVPDTSRSI